MKLKFKITGMSCAACAARVERAVSGLEGVEECSVNLLRELLTVEADAAPEQIKAAVILAGYGVKDDTGEGLFEKPNKSLMLQRRILRLVVSLVLSLVLSIIAMGHMVGLPVLFEDAPLYNALLQAALCLAVMVINRAFFINGIKGAFHLAPNMDTLVSLGSFTSFAYSVYITVKIALYNTGGAELLHGLYFESAAMILALISLGKLLEAIAKGKTTSAVESLIDLSPKIATLIIDGGEVKTPAENIKPGDIFIVRPGEKIATDGVVISGEAAVDESALTGESIPTEKAESSKVYAATVISSGYLVCRASVASEGTVLAEIVKMVSDATATKAPIARLADKVAGVFVPAVILISALTFGLWLALSNQGLEYAITRATAVLVISCPCALGLATPVAIMVGSGVGAKRGVLYKNAEALEIAGRVKTVVLDKTGTITEGKMSVTNVIPIGTEKDGLLSVALGLEKYSEHPIARAVCEYAEALGVEQAEIVEFKSLSGRGVYGKGGNFEYLGVSLGYAKMQTNIDITILGQCEKLASEGKTPILFLKNGTIFGIIAVADKIKADAKVGIAMLHRLGVCTVMLTGDNSTVANAVAERVCIDKVIAEVLPAEKESKIRELAKKGKVCMVGDGINDAPALTRADLGVAIGCGTDIAIESAGVVLINGNISDVAATLSIGRKTLRIIKENLFWAFIYNCIGIPLAAGAFGFALPPMFGAFAMSLSSFTVVLNALRLNLWKPILIKEKSEMENKKTFNVEGMMCPHCEARVKSVLEAIDGISLAEPSHKKKKVTLTLNGTVEDSVIIQAIEGAGYKVV